METKEAPVKTEPPKQPTISRAQRRFNDRVEAVAQKTFDQLAEKFLEFFLANDPESDAVMEKAKEVVAKWKMICGKMRLNEKARSCRNIAIRSLSTTRKRRIENRRRNIF